MPEEARRCLGKMVSVLGVFAGPGGGLEFHNLATEPQHFFVREESVLMDPSLLCV